MWAQTVEVTLLNLNEPSSRASEAHWLLSTLQLLWGQNGANHFCNPLLSDPTPGLHPWTPPQAHQTSAANLPK